MVWTAVIIAGMWAILGEGYLPPVANLKEISHRFFRAAGSLDFSNQDSAAVWTLSTLARRHVRYRRKIDPRRIDLQTLILQRSPTGDGALDQWFDDDTKRKGKVKGEYRLVLHTYPEYQANHRLWWNIFAYPYTQLGMRYGVHPYAHLESHSSRVLKDVAESTAAGHATLTNLLSNLNHPYVSSSGWPARDSVERS